MTSVVSALRPEDFYHTGIVVPDLDAAMARLSALAGYRWITPLSYTLPFRTATGNPRTHLDDRLLAAELRTSNSSRRFPDSPWTAAPGNSVHHLGYFTDNLAETARMLEDNGFTFEATADDLRRRSSRCSPTTSTHSALASRSSTARCFPTFRHSCSRAARRAILTGSRDMLLTVLRFNFASPQGEPRTQSKLIVCRTRTGAVGRVPRHHLGQRR